MQDNYGDFEKFFIGYKLCWIPATRVHSRGRAIGGYLFGYKLENLNCKFITIQNNIALKLTDLEESFYIFPIYLNCNNWEHDFSELDSLLKSFDASNTMLVGDFNARLADQQIESDTRLLGGQYMEKRQSKDKVLNRNGRRLLELFQTFDIFLLNGSINGDALGELTFVGGPGASVVDFCGISGRWLERVEAFKVEPSTFSDHMPITVTLSLEKAAVEKNIGLLPKLYWRENEKNVYNARLEQLLTQLDINFLSTNQQINCLVGAIKGSTSIPQSWRKVIGKQKWFDNACERARSKSFKLLKLARIRDDVFFRKAYIQANTQYKELCKLKQNEYVLEIARNLHSIKDATSFWKLAKELNGNTFKIGKNMNAESLADHFKNLLNPQQIVGQIQYAENFSIVSSLDHDIATGEIASTLKRAKDNKAPGHDRVSYEFFKNAPSKFLALLAQTYSKILHTSEVPESFRKSIVFPIHKKGDVNNAENYRGISFMNVVAKIFTGILLNRLEVWVKDNNLLCEFQAGFRAGYTTADHIFAIHNIVQCYLQKRKKLYAIFIDFKAAFDSINRSALFYKLSKVGISTKFLNVLKELYKDTFSAVWDGESMSDWFGTMSGVRQGCLLSPLLFALYINDIVEVLPSGIKIAETVIKCLLYADDLVVFAESPESLQLMINKLSEYCKTWDLVVNIAKTKAMIFRAGGGRHCGNERWVLNGENIEVVNEFKYLGVLLTPQLNLKKHLQAKLKTSIYAINSTWKSLLGNKAVSHSVKYKVFEAAMRSIMTYGAQVWGYQQHDEVEKLQRFFLKKIFRLPQSTPNYMLLLETGLPPLFLFTLKLHFQYIIKVLAYEDERLPKILAKHCIQKNIGWFKKWEEITSICGVSITAEEMVDPLSLKEKLGCILVSLDAKLRLENIEEAKGSICRSMYPKLEYNWNNNNYFLNSLSLNEVSNIFRLRGELLNLNYRPYVAERNTLCSLCNMQEQESSYHFLSVCPILKELRFVYFRKATLTESDSIRILNGENWKNLAQYCTEALAYRKDFID